MHRISTVVSGCGIPVKMKAKNGVISGTLERNI